MIKNNIISFDRKIQVWAYSVSHGQLLLRSTKDKDYKTQVDVLFKRVILIQIPTFFSDLIVSEMNKEEFYSLNLSTGLFSVEERKCYKVSGDNWHGVVVAASVVYLEEDAEHFSESKLIPKI